MRLLCSLAFLTAASLSVAGDWPIFRGNAAQEGVSTEKLPDKLVELWQFKTGKGEDSIDGAPAVVGGVVYVASQDQHVSAVNLSDGMQKWRFKAPAPIKTSPAVRNGRVYVGDLDGNFFCLDVATGKELWKFQAQSEISSGAAFAGDKIMFGSGDESLYCLDEKGQKVWDFKVPGGPVMATPAVEKNLTFVSGCDSKLHIVNTANGNEVAAIDIGGQTGATPSLKGGLLYLATMSNQVLAIDLKKNEIAWAFDSNRGQPFYASTSVTDRYVIAGARDKRLYCLNRQTGAKVWDFVTQGRIEGSPVVVGERVYAGSMDGNLYAIDLAKGAELQRVKLDSAVTGSIAVADGRLLVGTQNGTLYCFGKK